MFEDPYTLAVATALAANAATATAGTAWRSVVRLVRKRLDATGDSGVLETAQADPENEEAVSQLAEAITRAAEDDSTFAEELQRLWPAAQQELDVSEGATLNSVSGTVHGPVVQARTVHNPDMRTRPGPPPPSSG